MKRRRQWTALDLQKDPRPSCRHRRDDDAPCAGETLGMGSYGHVTSLSSTVARKDTLPFVPRHGHADTVFHPLPDFVVRETSFLRFLEEMDAQVAPPVRAMSLSARHPLCRIDMSLGVPLTNFTMGSKRTPSKFMASKIMAPKKMVVCKADVDVGSVARKFLQTAVRMAAAGVRHRDLSPGNALYSRTLDKVWIIDWGFAGCAAHDCVSGAVQGTVNYSAPEVALASASTAFDSSAADVWSAAAVVLALFVDLASEWPTVFGDTWPQGTPLKRAALARTKAFFDGFGWPEATSVVCSLPGFRWLGSAAGAGAGRPGLLSSYACVQGAVDLPVDLCVLLEAMWSSEPESRPTWEAIAEHPAVDCMQEYCTIKAWRESTVVPQPCLQWVWDAEFSLQRVAVAVNAAVDLLAGCHALATFGALVLVVPLLQSWAGLGKQVGMTWRGLSKVHPPPWSEVVVGGAAARVSCKFLGLPHSFAVSPGHPADVEVEAWLLRCVDLPPLPALLDGSPVAGSLGMAWSACPPDSAMRPFLCPVLGLLLADAWLCALPPTAGFMDTVTSSALLWEATQAWWKCRTTGTQSSFCPGWRVDCSSAARAGAQSVSGAIRVLQSLS
jgi:hypothetical protein